MRATSTKVQKLGFRKITFPSRAPFAPGRSARGLVCKCLPRVTDFSPSSTSAFSRAFQMSSNSLDGAVPIRPGWMRPGKRTPTHTHVEFIKSTGFQGRHYWPCLITKNSPAFQELYTWLSNKTFIWRFSLHCQIWEGRKENHSFIFGCKKNKVWATQDQH